MTVQNIITAALAYAYEEPDKDVITRNIEIPLINLGIAELTDAENAFRANKEHTTQLALPIRVARPEDDVPYDYHITDILLPLWLCNRIFEGMDDHFKAEYYRSVYIDMYHRTIPAEWDTREAVRQDAQS